MYEPTIDIIYNAIVAINQIGINHVCDRATQLLEAFEQYNTACCY